MYWLLVARTEKQLDIKLALHLEAKLSVSEQDELIVDLKRQAKAMLEDPWTQLRQHLLHIYKVQSGSAIVCSNIEWKQFKVRHSASEYFGAKILNLAIFSSNSTGNPYIS